MSLLNFFGFGNTLKYVRKIENLKAVNNEKEKEKNLIKKELEIVDKAKADLEGLIAGYMGTIEDLKGKLEAFRESDMQLSKRESQIISAARKGEHIYTVFFPEGIKATEYVSKDVKVPSKAAVRNAAKRFGLSQTALIGTRTERWEL